MLNPLPPADLDDVMPISHRLPRMLRSVVVIVVGLILIRYGFALF